MLQLNKKYKGTGPFTRVANDINELKDALNGISFVMPAGYSGASPIAYIKDGSFIIDMGGCCVFSQDNVEVQVSGETVSAYKIICENGALFVSVDVGS